VPNALPSLPRRGRRTRPSSTNSLLHVDSRSSYRLPSFPAIGSFPPASLLVVASKGARNIGPRRPSRLISAPPRTACAKTVVRPSTTPQAPPTRRSRDLRPPPTPLRLPTLSSVFPTLPSPSLPAQPWAQGTASQASRKHTTRAAPSPAESFPASRPCCGVPLNPTRTPIQKPLLPTKKTPKNLETTPTNPYLLPSRPSSCDSENCIRSRALHSSERISPNSPRVGGPRSSSNHPRLPIPSMLRRRRSPVAQRAVLATVIA